MTTTADSTPTYDDLVKQEDIDEYLRGIGLDPMQVRWEELQELICPLIPRFLRAGGTYKGKDDTTNDIPTMVVSYGDNWLDLVKDIDQGYTVIRVREPNLFQLYHRVYSYMGIPVHPKHLDAVLCHMLIGPDANAGLYQHAVEHLGTSSPPLTVDAVVPLIPKFIEAGGTHEQVVDTSDGTAISGVRATYEDRSVLVANPMLGTSGIALMVPNNLDTGFTWETIVLHPQDLDAGLCYWLKVPESEPTA
jgi:hypothetical protein